MAHHASLTGAAGESIPPGSRHGSRASMGARELPPSLRAARDELFRDADRHGPRWQVLARRVVPTLLAMLGALLLAGFQPWRAIVVAAAAPYWSDLILVVPVLVGVVVLAAALAPLARTRVEPLVGIGLVLLATGLWMVSSGVLVPAVVPTTAGALLVGIATARAVRRAVWTLPVLLAAGVSDVHSVEAGVTSRLLDGEAPRHAVEQVDPTLSIAAELVVRADLFLLHLPAATGTWLLGIVDIVAIGMLLGLAHLFWLPLGRTGIALGLALVATVGLGVPAPVLPVLGLAWVLVHARLVWRSTRFSLRRLTYLGG